MKNELYILLEKFLQKKASIEETTRLTELFHQADSKEMLFNLYEEKWESITSVHENPEVQERIWMRLQEQLNADTAVPAKLSIWKKYARIAAAILLPFFFACLGYYYSENKFYQSTDKMLVHVERGQKADLQLPDGTQIWLNSATSLTYDKTYNQKDRVIYLQGEAYFEVKKDKTKPFIVKADEISVEAIGTSFNVKAYPEDDYITTTLIEGSVRVGNFSSSSLLAPNEKLVFSRADRQFAKKLLLDAEKHASWRNNQLAFEQERLEDIAKVLERMYNIRIKFASENLKNIRFSGKVKNNNLESILQLIAFVSPIHYSMDKDSTVIIRENPSFNRHTSQKKKK
jgi:ferric-dicitrate binding protein FerR (iron transport regulator)